jgi:hypothetical protein
MLLAPAAAGNPAVTAVKLVPPFHANVVTSQYIASSGCAAAKQPDPPQFSNANGVALAREWTNAGTGCAAGSGYGYVYNSLTISWAIPIATSGHHSIKINAAYSFNTSVAIAFTGPCPTTTSTSSYGTFTSGYCSVSSTMGFQGPLYLMDATNYSAIASPQNLPPFALSAENTVSIYYGCYSPSYGGTCFSYNSSTYSLKNSYAVPTTGPIPAVFWINGTLNSTHSYVLYWYGSTFTTASASGWPTASAKSHLDFQTGGNGVFFHSIIIH